MDKDKQKAIPGLRDIILHQLPFKYPDKNQVGEFNSYLETLSSVLLVQSPVERDGNDSLLKFIQPLSYDSLSMDSMRRPPYAGSPADVAEILQREFGVTRANDSKPVLATYALAWCVGFAGWSPEHKVGFLTHYDAGTRLDESLGYLLYELIEQLHGQPAQFDVRIVGGYTGQSESIIDFLKSRLDIRPDIRMNLLEEDTGGSCGGKSIALDTRTGKTFSYDPMQNPNHRLLEEWRLAALTSGKGPARLAYKAR